MFKLALDAGHGLYTPGKRCLKSLDKNETREWWLNDRIADRVESLLKSFSGCSVLRVDDTTGDVDVSLSARVKKANEWGADFYLSIHHNAGINGGAGGGIISIAYTDASKESLEYQKILYDELIKLTGLHGNRAVPCPLQNLMVLRETSMPAVMVECGYMDSSTDVPVILTDEFASKCAQGIVNALVEIGGLGKKENVDILDGDSKVTPFKDIDDSYAKKDIEDLFSMGIVNGVTETEFMPKEYITREAMAKIARNVIRYITGK